MGDFVAARLALADRSAEAPEGFQKEGLDVVRLQAARFGALHLFAHPRNATDVHHLVRQGALFDQRFEAGAVDAAGNRLFETGAHSGTVAVADRVDQQIAQRPAVELKFAQHVEDLPAERLARFFEFVEQAAVHVAFARLDRHQVPQVTHVGLPDAVDAPKPLLDAVRVPGKVVIDHQMGALQVDAFSAASVAINTCTSGSWRNVSAPCAALRAPCRRGWRRAPRGAPAACRSSGAGRRACRGAR